MLFISKADSRIEDIKNRLKLLQSEYPHELSIINIDSEEVLQSEYAGKTPVLDIGVYRLVNTFEIDEMKLAFEKAATRLKEAQVKGNRVLEQRISEPLKMEKADRFSNWFSNKYMFILNFT